MFMTIQSIKSRATAVGAGSSAIAVPVASRRWLRLRSATPATSQLSTVSLHPAHLPHCSLRGAHRLQSERFTARPHLMTRVRLLCMAIVSEQRRDWDEPARCGEVLANSFRRQWRVIDYESKELVIPARFSAQFPRPITI